MNSRFSNTIVFQKALIYIMKNNEKDIVEDMISYLNEMNPQLDNVIYEEESSDSEDDDDQKEIR